MDRVEEDCCGRQVTVGRGIQSHFVKEWIIVSHNVTEKPTVEAGPPSRQLSCATLQICHAEVLHASRYLWRSCMKIARPTHEEADRQV